MDELREKCSQHFTAAEFAEFLDLSVEDIFDRFSGKIEEKYKDIAEETCFEFDRNDD